MSTDKPKSDPVKGKPTPGKWEIGHPNIGSPDDGTRHNANQIYSENGQPICVVSGLFSQRELKELKADTTNAKFPGSAARLREGLANAQLIISAKELLEALESTLNQFCYYDLYADTIEALKKARTVIAKAKGEVDGD